MFRFMFTLILLVGFGNSFNGEFPCSDTTELNDDTYDSTNPNQDTCCIEKTAECALTCDNGKMWNAWLWLQDEEDCCVDEVENTCGYLDPLTQEESIFSCPSGTIFDWNNLYSNTANGDPKDICCAPATCGNTTSEFLAEGYQCPASMRRISQSDDIGNPSDDNCCEVFDATCAENSYILDTEWQMYLKQPFDCPAGQKLRSGQASAGASVENCCEVLVPSCGNFTSISCTSIICLEAYQYMSYESFVSSGFVSAEFECLDGFQFKSSSSEEEPNNEACCEAFVPTCAMYTSDGAPFKCPNGPINVDNAYDASPSESICCGDRTCGDYKQWTCAEYLIDSPVICEGLGLYVNSANSDMLAPWDPMNFNNHCCQEDNPSSAGSLAPASSAIIVLFFIYISY